jgi:hypothetical protein
MLDKFDLRFPSFAGSFVTAPTLPLTSEWKMRVLSEGVQIAREVVGGESCLLIDTAEAAQKVVDFIRVRFPDVK